MPPEWVEYKESETFYCRRCGNDVKLVFEENILDCIDDYGHMYGLIRLTAECSKCGKKRKEYVSKFSIIINPLFDYLKHETDWFKTRFNIMKSNM